MEFARNAWYVAAWSDEIVHEIFARDLLGEPVVLFRKTDGTVAATRGICPHRFAPLAKGRLRGDHVQCVYHGLEFDGSGRCTKNPHSPGARIPDGLKLPAYVVHERHTMVWIWMGDAALADVSKIPDFSHLTDPARKTMTGNSIAHCDYRLLIDNLMDLGHFQFLHGMATMDEGVEEVRRKTWQDGETVYNDLTYPGVKATILFQAAYPDPATRLDQFNDMRWDPVGLMRNHIGVTPVGQPKEAGANHYGTHIVTPATPTSCHYFYGSSRNFSKDDPVAEQRFRDWQRRALNEEDKPMLEAIHHLTPIARDAGMPGVMLVSDAAAVRVQRLIAGMAAREAQQRVRIPITAA